MLRIESIDIYNINSISCLNLNFQPNVNILCGTNGIGKTTILESIHNFFHGSYSTPVIREKVDTENSTLGLTVILDDQEENYFYDFSKIDGKDSSNKLRIPSLKLIYYSISQRQSARVPPLRINDDGRTMARSSYDTVKSWFFRCYFNKKQMTEDKFSNLLLTKEVFNKLDPSVTFIAANEKYIRNRFSDDETKAVEILLKTSYGTIDMDFMSSGYKACFNILFGIIRNIEERLHMSVKNFDGVVLIDEIDLHLHPEWQTKIIEILKWLIPNAQIIITTHSPHVIQNADQGEIIPLGIDEKRRVYVRELPENSEYGYQGWTIEEILQDVMGLKNTHSELYYQLLREFDMALNNLDIQKATDSYNKIDRLLHPDNHLRKIFKIQLGSLGGLDIDKN